MVSCSGMFTFLVIFVVVALVVAKTSQRRAYGRQSRLGPPTCSACGEAHPRFAQFCRRCGRRLQ